MQIPIEQIGDVKVLVVPVAELDAETAGEFSRDIGPAVENASKVVLDLGRLRFLDSSGLGAFLHCLHELEAKGGRLKLCGMSETVRAIFESVRLQQVFDIHPGREEAIRAFQQAA